MLDRSKVAREFASRGDELFIDYSNELAIARMYWQKILADPVLQQKIPFVQSVGILPTWQDALDATSAIDPIHTYHVLAVDGSQIYPDRHQGVSCYLVNTGSAYCKYAATGIAQFNSEPRIASGITEAGEITPDIVDCIRTELELRDSLIKSREYRTDALEQYMVMMDGSLIFWHLDSKDDVTKNRFLTSYLTIFQQLYTERILHAGVISLPKSKELVHIIAAAVKVLGKEDTFTHCVDTDIALFFLVAGQRTGVFKNNSPIVSFYQEMVQPYFFYMHTGYEIVRCEIPAWIAREHALVDTVARIVLDQTKKGYGYPVCLAEAHEQAVVKGADREFFYLMLQKMALARNQRYAFSQKSMKKRMISV